MSRIADNIRQILERIHEFEQRYGRPEGSVTLLAVSKNQPIDRIREARAAGISDFGENYLQQAQDNIEALADPGIEWHFIGPLQSNKTRPVAALCSWVHSVDRFKIAQRLSDQRVPDQPPLNVCIQVNVGGEDTKSGVRPDQALTLCRQVNELPNLRLRGLMAIPAPQICFDAQRSQFRELAQLFAKLRDWNPRLDTLSMGMSDDYEAAIAEGSTLVRIGTALFGPRAG